MAGFKKEQIDIIAEGDKLSIIGKKEQRKEKIHYLYQGISERGFERSFQIAENIEIIDANFSDGLLHINLQRIIPESLKPRKIKINSLLQSS